MPKSTVMVFRLHETGDGAAMRDCRHCGASFEPAKSHHQFCSARCRQTSFEASQVIPIVCRVSSMERQQLTVIAAEQGESVSGLIREALYRQYGIGWLTPSSLCAIRRITTQ